MQSLNSFLLFFAVSHSQPASYGKKNGVWYASPGNQGWGGKSGAAGTIARKSSIVEADNMPSNTVKPSAGRVIRIINSNDHTVQVNQYGKLCHKTPLGILFDDHFQPLNHTITLKNIGFF